MKKPKKQRKTSIFSAWFRDNILDSGLRVSDFVRGLNDNDVLDLITEVGLGRDFVITEPARIGLEQRLIRLLSEQKSRAVRRRNESKK